MDETSEETPLLQYDNETQDKEINPFAHKYEIKSNSTKLKLLFMSIFVFPIKIFVLCIVLIVGYIVSCTGMWGLSKEEMNEIPHTGWRNVLRGVMGLLGRIMMRIYGFQWMTIKGQRASRDEAPIIVVAPHSSFMDAISVFWSGMPGLVNREENLQIPMFGKYINFTQPIYVSRGDSKTRSSTIHEIEKRARSKVNWPQIMIFPEGTCTNRSCLITFKPGAFHPGVPVQPLVIRYPNLSDCFTWTWDGPGALKIIWATLCQFHNYCELEYLPVYRPTQEEQNNPHLYASNVRDVMADALSVPVVDYTYDDCRLMHKAKLKKLPCNVGLVGIQSLRQKLGIPRAVVEEEIFDHFATIAGKDGKIRIENLSKFLGIRTSEPSLVQIFNLYDQSGCGEVSFKDYLIGYWEHVKKANSPEVLKEGFETLDKNTKGFVTADDVIRVLKSALDLPEEEAKAIFTSADVFQKGQISFDEFVVQAKRRPEYAQICLFLRKIVLEGFRTDVSNEGKTKAE